MPSKITAFSIKRELGELLEFLEENKMLVVMQRPISSLSSMMVGINASQSYWDWLAQHQEKKAARFARS